MRFAAYVILLFSISAMAYFFGFPSILLYLYENNGSGNLDMTSFINSMADTILNPENGTATLLLGGIILASTLATFLGGGYLAVYLVPMLILMAVLNLVVFPLSFIFDAALPLEFKVLISGFFNVLTVLAAVGFIRGNV